MSADPIVTTDALATPASVVTRVVSAVSVAEDLSSDLAAASLVLARLFSAGATLWCIAPAWEPHAQHVAVEFVHPVIVGKKALPAVALTGPDLVATVRMSVRPGDVVLAVAATDQPDVRSVMRRAPAWGATTLWIGSGARPDAGAADHVLWLDDPDPRLPATGGFVLLYHLLWELTHVCFEHPGLLAPETPVACTTEGSLADPSMEPAVCITCSDEGRLGEVVGPGRARTATGTEDVATVLVDPVVPGDLLLIHAGMAITKVEVP
ncbi:hydrogenase assembly protein HupF [Pseudonocardia sp.]|uniref:hydrogenase assembly protein HupF n=1 Tax=Pseudonocardia sp. TaxID=60912 RepID=UPI0025E82B15|nr:hydrogenase assembly protein HupF [Pseudonocardia sp.]